MKEIYKKLRPKKFWKHISYLKKSKGIIFIIVLPLYFFSLFEVSIPAGHIEKNAKNSDAG